MNISSYAKCPYFNYERKNKIACEHLATEFKSKDELNEHGKAHCCDIEGMKKCSTYKELTKGWEANKAV